MPLKINDRILNDLEITIIYTFGKSVKWAKTGKKPLPFFFRLFDSRIRKEVEELTYRLRRKDKIFNIYKKGKEDVIQFTGQGFDIGLKVRDYMEGKE